MSLKNNIGEGSSSQNKKLTLKLSLNKEDLIKKFKTSSQQASAGLGLITRMQDKEEVYQQPSDLSEVDLSNTEKQKRIKALESYKEKLQAQTVLKPAFEDIKEDKILLDEPKLQNVTFATTKPKSEAMLHPKITDAISAPLKIDLKTSDTKVQKVQGDISETISLNFKQSESSILPEEESSEQKTPIIDNRNKTLIEERMKHYQYLEFDNEDEIKALQAGHKLRQALEGKRKEVSKNEDEDIVISSIAGDFEDGASKARKEAFFSRHSKKPKKKRLTDASFLQREVEIYDQNIVIDIARSIAVKVEELLKKLRHYGINVKETDAIDGDAAELVVEEMGHVVKRVKKLTAEDKLTKQALLGEDLRSANPIVAVMGHVDHGKTSLLDALRKSSIAEREAGGITQKIGAYQVEISNDKKITFLDTPGHEAFTAVRSMGSEIVHVIVIVIAADDGIMPQTLESINYAKASGAGIVVAINKIDKPGSDVTKIKNELLVHGIICDEFGGDVLCVPISAKTGQNLDKLLDAILLQAEVIGIQSDFGCRASGVVLEAKLDKQKGISASLLIQNGILKVGDIVLIDSSYAKVRLMLDSGSQNIKEAEPSMPVEIYGLSDIPMPGQQFNVIESEKLAKEIAEHRKQKKVEQKTSSGGAFTKLFGSQTKAKVVNILIRADVQSSIEAIKYGIEKINLPEDIEIKIMQTGIGNVTEADIKFAKTYNAQIFAFSCKVGSKEEEIAKKMNVEIKQHNIIYNLIDDIKVMLSSMLSPLIKDEVIGDVEVREIFDIFKIGKIAGSVIKKGVAQRNAVVKIFRDGKEIGEGKLKTLKHFKENVKELAQGNECGIQVENFEGFKRGDMLQIIKRTEEKKVL